MRKALPFILAMMMAGCAEQQVLDVNTTEAPAQMTETESPDNLLAQAKWGDGNAYLKLAENFAKGNYGSKPDFISTISMLTMAKEFGAINQPMEYMSRLPEDNSIRLTFDAMENLDGGNREKGLEQADHLISSGCADGYALKAFALMDTGDSIEALRMATLAAEKGSDFGRLLLHLIPFAHMAKMPEESVMVPMAEIVPIFFRFMAEEYDIHLADHPEDEVKVAKYYMKTDEYGLLDPRGAKWLLSYAKSKGKLPLTETDLLRLEKLANHPKTHFITDEDDIPATAIWEEPADSVAVDVEEIVKAAETAQDDYQTIKGEWEDNNKSHQ